MAVTMACLEDVNGYAGGRILADIFKFSKTSFVALATCLFVQTMPLQGAGADILHEAALPSANAKDVPLHSWRNSRKMPRAIVIALHGSVQHGAYMSEIGRQLAQEGVVTYAPDLRGHGKWLSAGRVTDEQKDIDYNVSADDVKELATGLREKYPGVPLFALGESVGSAVAIMVASKNRGLFDGLILCSPGAKPAVSDFKTLAGTVAGGIASVGTSIDLSKSIGKNISDDARTRAELMNDPDVHKTSNLSDLLHTVLYLRKAKSAAKSLPNDIKILVMQGEEDRILNPDGAVDLYDILPNADKQIKLVPDTGHILVTGSYIKPHVAKVVSDWLMARTGGNGTKEVSYTSPQ